LVDRLAVGHRRTRRHAKAGDLDVTTARDQDVAGLDVTMHDTAGVSGVECIGDLRADGDHGRRLERTSPCVRAECDPVDELHHEEQTAVCFPDVVHGADVRMRKPRGRLHLAFETGTPFSGQGVADDFDRHVAAESCISRSIDFAHSAGAKRFENLVRAQRSAARKGMRRWRR
jgi:hypothetical protein